MRRKIFKNNLKSIASKIMILITLLTLLITGLGLSEAEISEELRFSYFVSPEYPRVARQLRQSGDVVLTVTVDKTGRPSEIEVQAPHVLLGESAKAVVSKWRFSPLSSSHKYPIFFHYGFSGTPRECNASTIVTVDLNAPRITITVDPLPPFGPDAWSQSDDNESP
jgi:TonB family protein